ncbi:hypothetical protein EA462_13080 [Natrarchaeobius halalkaliphilus]|uniref:Uncharacterized protein n=2 Tax=Natrarchaeobius halalkaliphilus TaxID=1679091 RepID=A0A3N6LL67_9EURY|nr:hypothetical protein EA462_13080 [Natrarchaeobius halalkaliphilus]
MGTIRNNPVYRILDKIRSSAALTITFWGGVMTLIAFVIGDGVWAGIAGIWGLSLLVFGACWYVAAIRYVKPDRPEETNGDATEGGIDWGRVGTVVGASSIFGVYMAYVTSGIGLELVVLPVAFVAAAAFLYRQSTTLETLGYGMYVLGLSVFVTPLVFHFGAIPQSAYDAGIQIDHMLALGSILFMFTLIAFLLSLMGYFLNNRAQKKSDQQRLKSRMGFD